jgi:hypothetical protein
VGAGAPAAAVRALYERKLDYLEAVGGCAVMIFHPGTFDEEDAALRERLLDAFMAALAGRRVWRCSLSELERWWRSREGLRAELAEGGRPALTNIGARTSAPAQVRWRDGDGAERSHEAPALEPGATWRARPEPALA